MNTNNSGIRSCKYPFTANQWQELEHQALVFKYMICGLPVPPDLLFTIRTSLDSSKFIIHQPQIGWNSFQMGFGRKIDPEPGRCRRTDGKKWRCSKETYPDSKYCERHMHRGRNRSRKPVEILSPNANKNTTNPSSTTYLSEPHFLYSHFSSSQESTTNFNFLGSNNDLRNNSGGDETNLNSSCKLTMGSSLSQIKHNAYSYNCERDQQPKKVLHHFRDDQCPPNSHDSYHTPLHDFFMTQK